MPQYKGKWHVEGFAMTNGKLFENHVFEIQFAEITMANF